MSFRRGHSAGADIERELRERTSRHGRSNADSVGGCHPALFCGPVSQPFLNFGTAAIRPPSPPHPRVAGPEQKISVHVRLKCRSCISKRLTVSFHAGLLRFQFERGKRSISLLHTADCGCNSSSFLPMRRPVDLRKAFGHVDEFCSSPSAECNVNGARENGASEESKLSAWARPVLQSLLSHPCPLCAPSESRLATVPVLV